MRTVAETQTGMDMDRVDPTEVSRIISTTFSAIWCNRFRVVSFWIPPRVTSFVGNPGLDDGTSSAFNFSEV